MRILAGIWLVVALAALSPAAAPPPPAPAEVLKLIDQLGDDDDDVRKAAMDGLQAQGEKALSAVRHASVKHLDADVRLRAAVVAAAIQKALYGELRVFEGHRNWVIRVAITPDGKYA